MCVLCQSLYFTNPSTFANLSSYLSPMCNALRGSHKCVLQLCVSAGWWTVQVGTSGLVGIVPESYVTEQERIEMLSPRHAPQQQGFQQEQSSSLLPDVPAVDVSSPIGSPMMARSLTVGGTPGAATPLNPDDIPPPPSPAMDDIPPPPPMYMGMPPPPMTMVIPPLPMTRKRVMSKGAAADLAEG